MASTISIHVAVSSARASLASLGSSIRSFGSSMISSLGSAASSAGSSIATGLGDAFKSAGSNPYVLAGVTGLVGVLAPVIGTLLGGAIVLGVGAGIAGIGLMAAAKAKDVQKAFGDTKKVISKTLSDAAKPLQPVLIHAAKSVSSFVKEAGPALSGIFKNMAPHLTKFFDSLMSGFKKAAPALKPLTDAFNMMLDALGPVFTKVLADTGKALGDLGKQFQNKDTIAGFTDIIGALFSLLPTGIKILTGLAKVFTEIWPAVKQLGSSLLELGQAVGPLFLIVLKGYIEYIKILYPILAKVISFIAQFISTIVSNAPAVVEAIKPIVQWIGRIVGKTVVLAQKGASAVIKWVKDVIAWVKNIKNKTVSFFQKGASTVIGWVKSAINWIRNLKGKTVSILQKGASGVISMVGNAIGKIKRFVGKTVSIGVRGAGAAINAVQGVINRIKNFVGKTVSIGVNFFKGAGSKLASALGFAHGGYVGTAATGGPRSNQVLVGEHGPEIVDLAPGSRVRSNPDTRRMLLGNSGASNIMHVTIQVGDKALGDLIIDPLKKTIRTKGGNVQAVLGT